MKRFLTTNSKDMDNFFSIFYTDYKLRIGITELNVKARLIRVRDYIESHPELKDEIKKMMPSDLVDNDVVYSTAIFEPSSIIIPTCEQFNQKVKELCRRLDVIFRGYSQPIITNNYIMLPFYEIKNALIEFKNRQFRETSIFSEFKRMANMEEFLILYDEFISYIYQYVNDDKNLKLKPDESITRKAIYFKYTDIMIDQLCDMKIDYTWFHNEFLGRGLFGPTNSVILYNSVLKFDDLDLVIDDVVNGEIQFDYLFTRNGKPAEESDFPSFNSEHISRVIKNLDILFSDNSILKKQRGMAELSHIFFEYLDLISDEDLEIVFLNFPRGIIDWLINNGIESWITLWKRLRTIPSLELYFRTSDILSDYERGIIEELDELDAEANRSEV